MTKTTHSGRSDGLKIEVGITAEMVAALSTIPLTVETIDISSIVTNVGGSPGVVREVIDQHVVGDPTPITDMSTKIARSDLTVEFLWTEGKETFGTDLLDFYTDVLLPLSKYTDGMLSMPITYSLPGGNVGDLEIATAPTETLLTNLPIPIGGVDAGGKTKVVATFTTSDFTMAAVA